MFCTGCGNKLTTAERFCQICGTKNAQFQGDKQPVVGSQVESQQPLIGIQVEPQQPFTYVENQSMVETPPERVYSGHESAVIQPEILIPAVDQSNQRNTSGEMPLIEAGNVIVKQQTNIPVKVRKPKKEVGTGVKVASVFLSVLTFILLIVFLSSSYLKMTLSQKALETSILKIDYTTMQIGDILSDSNLDIGVDSGDTTIDVIYEALTKQGRVEITRGDVEEILEETTFNEYLAEKLSSYARYAITGAEPDEINSREIIRLVEKNIDTIEDIIDMRITSNDLDELESYLEEDGILEAISLDKIDEAVKENKIEGIQKLLSDTLLFVLALISLLLLIGIIVWISVLHKEIKAPLSYIGIPVLTGGLLFTIVFLILNIIKGKLFKDVEEIYNSIKPFASSVLTRGLLMGIITTAIGLLMVVSYVMLKKLQNRDNTQINPAQ